MEPDTRLNGSKENFDSIDSIKCDDSFLKTSVSSNIGTQNVFNSSNLKIDYESNDVSSTLSHINLKQLDQIPMVQQTQYVQPQPSTAKAKDKKKPNMLLIIIIIILIVILAVVIAKLGGSNSASSYQPTPDSGLLREDTEEDQPEGENQILSEYSSELEHFKYDESSISLNTIKLQVGDAKFTDAASVWGADSKTYSENTAIVGVDSVGRIVGVSAGETYVITAAKAGSNVKHIYKVVVAKANNTAQTTDSTTTLTTEKEDSEAPDITFNPGNYGGVDFNSFEDVVNYYNTVYNATKAETAEYIDEYGSVETFYKMVGEESLSLKTGSLLVDGSENSLVNGMSPMILDNILNENVVGLPPSAAINPNVDIDENGKLLLTSRVTVDDIINCAIEDNKDGTIILTLVPQSIKSSRKGLDSQGHFFNSPSMLDSMIEKIDVLSWTSGTTGENVVATYKDGSVVVKVDVASGKIVEADYHMIVNLNIIHATIGNVMRDKDISLTLYYDNHFPASDEYLMETRQLART